MKNKQQELYDYMFKTILVGNSGVGKSHILQKFTKNLYDESLPPTYGVQYATKIVQNKSKTKVKLQIWDTAGQEQYKSLMKTFYKGTSAVLLTYDITDRRSFEQLDFWINQVSEFCKKEVVIVLVGNKLDLEEERVITKKEALAYAESKKIGLYETSAKNGVNIEIIFKKIAQDLQKIMDEGSEIKVKKTQSMTSSKLSNSILSSPEEKQKKQKNIQNKSINKSDAIQLKSTVPQKKKGGCCGKS